MCTINTSEIYLTWRKDVNTKRHIIGRLNKTDDGYSFEYIKENVELAIKEDGFTSYPPFFNLDEVYTEKVLETFSRRLLNPARSDYDEFLNYWGAIKYKNDIFSILGLTGAKLLTDNFEFIAPHKEIPAIFNTDISWLNTNSEEMVSEIKNSSNQEIEKKLTFELEPNNAYDNKAVKVLYNSKTLGYIKSIHCENIYDAILKNKDVNIRIANILKNGTIKEILLRINVD